MNTDSPHSVIFFFNDTATTEIYTLSLHDALPIYLILMDISMPVMDGFQATQQIRRQRRHACILMLTGSDSRTDLERAREAGAAGYVTKNRIAAELIDAILEVVER